MSLHCVNLTSAVIAELLWDIMVHPWPQLPLKPGTSLPLCGHDMIKRSLGAAKTPCYGKRPDGVSIASCMEGWEGARVGCHLPRHSCTLLHQLCCKGSRSSGKGGREEERSQYSHLLLGSRPASDGLHVRASVVYTSIFYRRLLWICSVAIPQPFWTPLMLT